MNTRSSSPDKVITNGSHFNRGALKLTVSILRKAHPSLALRVQNEMHQPVNPQRNNDPDARDNFKVTLSSIDVRSIVEALSLKGQEAQLDLGMQMLVKALIIDWVNYANYLIEQQNELNNKTLGEGDSAK